MAGSGRSPTRALRKTAVCGQHSRGSVAPPKPALKAHRQTVKRQEHNRQLRSRLRRALKTIRATIDAGETDQAKAALSETFSFIDKMASKGIIHANTAGRYKSRVSRRLTRKSATA